MIHFDEELPTGLFLLLLYMYLSLLETQECEVHVFIFTLLCTSGEFGDVYKGVLSRPGEEPIPVAVKTLKVQLQLTIHERVF